MVGERGGFEEEVEDGCDGRLTDKAAAAPLKRRRSQKRDKSMTNNDDDRQYTTIKQNTVEVGGRVRDGGGDAGGDGDDAEKYAALPENG
jgi:hypothetical protein